MPADELCIPEEEGAMGLVPIVIGLPAGCAVRPDPALDEYFNPAGFTAED